jgi:predicted Zn-dependent protease
MRAWFEQVADAVCVAVPGLDRVSLSFSAEASDFIRFNHAAVRQATHVQQRYATLTVIAGARRNSTTLALSGHAAADIQALLAERGALLAQLPLVPEDPYQLLPEVVVSSEREAVGALPAAQDVVSAVARYADGADLVGFYAAGPVIRAFADSRGQRNWHRVDSFHFDWCLYREGDQAVKTAYAGTAWDERVFAARVADARAKMEILARPRKTLAPGAYRVYFSPVAVADLLGTLSWGGFGERDVRTGVSTLGRLHRGEQLFHPSVRLVEASAQGLAPRFHGEGFVKPDEVLLVDAGRAAGTLLSPRTAREFGGSHNSGGGESPESLAMAPGTLALEDVLRTLGTGVYITDLHYLNYSDRQACRMTGMTRFACLWVENGEPVAPISVMRFDDSLLRMFGAGLVALTSQAEPVPENLTYGARQLRSITAPGAIVQDFIFTL